MMTQFALSQHAYKTCCAKGKSVYGIACFARTVPFPSLSVSTAVDSATASLISTNQSVVPSSSRKLAAASINQ